MSLDATREDFRLTGYLSKVLQDAFIAMNQLDTIRVALSQPEATSPLTEAASFQLTKLLEQVAPSRHRIGDLLIYYQEISSVLENRAILQELGTPPGYSAYRDEDGQLHLKVPDLDTFETNNTMENLAKAMFQDRQNQEKADRVAKTQTSTTRKEQLEKQMQDFLSIPAFKKLPKMINEQ
jgi:hypothetical protein